MKLAFLLPLFLLFGFFSAFGQEPEEEIFMLVEESPRFPGCEDLPKDERESCAQKKMLEFIYGTLKYPSEARENNIEGQVVVQFVINEKGEIEDINLVREIGAGCGEEVLRILNEMNNMSERWIPGKQRGRAVKVKYTLPVKFKL